MSTSQAQVRRLLALVPYLRDHDGATLDEVAAEFGVTPKQLVADLNVLWFCGSSTQMGDLIEIDFEAINDEGVIHLSNADYLARPLRLSADEALALLTALRTMAGMTGVSDRGPLNSAIGKLERAAGEAAAVHVHVEPPDPQVLARVNEAVQHARAVHLRYDVPARDETTDRDVDPMRLLLADGRHYLEAWCRSAQGVRLFRLDRIARIDLLDAPSEPPPQARPRDTSAGLFQASADHLKARLALGPQARWVAEYYPCESVSEATETDAGGLVVTMSVADPAWLQRLVLRLGGAARVLEPDGMQQRIAERAAAALVAYDS